MGRYVAPDDGSGDAAARRRGGRGPRAAAAATTTMTTTTVRFEMPFAVWCASCPQPTLIAQGVRFNAEKRRVGAYHSSPVWSFRLRHADCGGALEVRTDPRSTAYVVSGGTRRRGPGDDDGDGHGGAAADDDGSSSAFARRADARIRGLLDASARRWRDPYAQNQRLRDAFRAGRRAGARDARDARGLADAMGLALDLVAPHPDDARHAARVRFGGPPAGLEDHDDALATPLFDPPPPPPPSSSSSSGAPSKTRDGLVSALVSRTRAARDPFLRHGRPRPARTELPAPAPLRRKRPPHPPPPGKEPAAPRASLAGGGLVQYDSD